MTKSTDSRRRPHPINTLVDVNSDATVRDLGDALSTELRSDAACRILLVVGSFADGIALTEKLRANDPYLRVESCGNVKHMRNVMPRNDTQVFVIPSMIAEMGTNWPGFNVLYFVSCPGTESSVVQVVGRVLRLGRSYSRLRIFATTEVREVFENALWLDQRINTNFDVDAHTSYLENNRNSLCIVTPQNSESPMMVLSDVDRHNQVVIGFSTSGPDDTLHMVNSMQYFDQVFSVGGRDFLMRRQVMQMLMEHNAPIYINRMREGSMLTADGPRVGAAAQKHLLNTAIGNAFRNSHPLMTLLRRAAKSVPLNSLPQ